MKKNPLRRGYSAATLHANIAELIKAGHKQAQAVKVAFRVARIAWRAKHPTGLYPHHLRPAKPARKAARKNPVLPYHKMVAALLQHAPSGRAAPKKKNSIKPSRKVVQAKRLEVLEKFFVEKRAALNSNVWVIVARCTNQKDAFGVCRAMQKVHGGVWRVFEK